ncbi:MAG: DUF559 domain-containing protein [Elusimicrobiota bacterium]
MDRFFLIFFRLNSLQKNYDDNEIDFLKSRNHKFLRFWNNHVLIKRESVLESM